MFKEIKYFIQRGQRGWSDEDAWDADHHIGKVISGMVRKLAKENIGCPDDLWDGKAVNRECHKWTEILEEIAQGFEAAQEIKTFNFNYIWGKKGDVYDSIYREMKKKQLAKKYDRGMELFSKYFLNLWD